MREMLGLGIRRGSGGMREILGLIRGSEGGVEDWVGEIERYRLERGRRLGESRDVRVRVRKRR